MSERPSQDDDDLASLLRRTNLSPPARHDHDIRFQYRNSEDVHRDALAAAQAEHDRVREVALKAYELNELREEQLRLHRAAQQEEKRVRLEMARALEEARIREIENRAKRIPKPPPREPTPPPPSPPQSQPPKETSPIPSQRTPAAQPQPEPQALREQIADGRRPSPKPISNGVAVVPKTPIAAPQPPQIPLSQLLNPLAAPLPSPTQTPTQVAPHILPGVDRYTEIHKNLKQLRQFVTNGGKQDPTFKKKTGEMRRAIRQSVGQLTDRKGANKQPLNKIVELLRQSLTTVQSPPADPSLVMLKKPEPSEGARYNGEAMPVLFIYLLNVFAKSVVAQFIDEAGVAPKAADPVGVVAVSVFSREEFYWRNKPLIDILMAKIRVVCPVLFGLRGNEKTEEGRARLGWRKEGGSWVADQVHNTRMTGLGAGYAALCLRDFSKSELRNPWPPTHYWQAVASIVSTPPEQASPTQYMVLKSLIENYEMKFLAFYGSAARAALRIALVEFPARAAEKNVAVSSLKVLADKLNRDMGLQLQ